MKAAPYVVMALKRLAVSADTMAEATRAASAAGVREADAAVRFYREWVNDAIVSDGRRVARDGVKNPDNAFLEWLSLRLGDLFHVTFRAHEAVRASYGDETALLFSQVRWSQELAWASRMRGSDNDRIAVLAETWLTAARRDPATLFRGLVDVYADEGLAEPGYAKSVFHLLSVEEIQEGKGDDIHWRPLWLRFAEQQFGRRLNGMARGQLSQLAAKFRDGEQRDRTAGRRARQAQALRNRRPSLMIAVQSAAISRGLGSDDLVAAEAEFIRGVETGAIDLQDRARDAAWRIFMEQMGGWVGRVPRPGPDEAARRLEVIEQLPPTWASTLPAPFRDIGADDQRTLIAWFEVVCTLKTREPPADPVVDYGMWLLGDSREAA